MTSTEILTHRQAVALERGAKLAQGLAPLDETLRLVIDEPYPSDTHVLAEVTATLAKVCSEQRQHIIELAERIEALEKGEPAEK
jgi:hypothetical protein